MTLNLSVRPGTYFDGELPLQKTMKDTCTIVCESSWARTFEPDSAMSTALSDEPALIEAGLAEMKTRNAAVCIVMRDHEDLIPSVRAMVERLARRFNSTRVIVVENDSSHGLLSALSAWSDDVQSALAHRQYTGYSVVDVQVSSYKLNAQRTNGGEKSDDFTTGSRFHMLGILRNECLRALDRSSSLRDDLLINIDVDDDLRRGMDGFDIGGVVHAFGLKGTKETEWDAVCANGIHNIPFAERDAPDRAPATSFYQGTMYGASRYTSHNKVQAADMLFGLPRDSMQDKQDWGVQISAAPVTSSLASPAMSDLTCLDAQSIEVAACVMWRQTQNCNPDGQREPELDLPCDHNIVERQSGYCECTGSKRVKFRCSDTRPPMSCSHACKASHTIGREVVVDTCANVVVSVAPCGGSAGSLRYRLSSQFAAEEARSCARYPQQYASQPIQVNITLMRR